VVTIHTYINYDWITTIMIHPNVSPFAMLGFFQNFKHSNDMSTIAK
jgi:hypothetical protein